MVIVIIMLIFRVIVIKGILVNTNACNTVMFLLVLPQLRLVFETVLDRSRSCSGRPFLIFWGGGGRAID